MVGFGGKDVKGESEVVIFNFKNEMFFKKKNFKYFCIVQ